MKQLLFSEEAKRDLLDIKKYISTVLENPAAAKRLLNGITGKINIIRKFPMIGNQIRFLKSETKYRYTISGNYLIFYHIGDDKVIVDRVLYSKRDYLKVLFDEITDTKGKS